MISKKLFEKIEKEYGDVASWAVWAKVGETPKSNMGDLSVFDLRKNPSLLRVLNNNVIMVALNFSRPLEPVNPFKNFHDEHPSANDFKIRYAFIDTEFYGAYMTDIIKNLEEKDSNNVKEILKNNQTLVDENISIFRKELIVINSKDPIILAFGTYTYNLLNLNLRENEYSKLIKLPHYSKYISKENFKKEVYEIINDEMKISSNFTQIIINAQYILKEQVELIEKAYHNLHNNELDDENEKLLGELKSISEELFDNIKKIKLKKGRGNVT